MNEKINIDVIITCYNDEMYVREAVASVQDQTAYDNIDSIYIIDDCSKDRTKEIIDELSSGDKKIKTVFLKKNVGLAAARNVGILQSKNKYIAFLDSDDIWVKDKVECQVKMLDENSQIDLLYCDVIEFADWNDTNRFFKAKQYRGSGLLKQFFINDAPVFPSTVIISRRAINKVGDFDVSFRRAQDTELWYRIFAECYVYHQNCFLVRRRVRNDSLGSTWRSKNQYLGKAIEKIKSMYPHVISEKMIRQKKARLSFMMGKYLLFRGEYREAKKAFREAIMYDPRMKKSYLYLIMSIFNVDIKRMIKYQMIYRRSLGQIR